MYSLIKFPAINGQSPNPINLSLGTNAEKEYRRHILGDAGAETVGRNDNINERRNSNLGDHACPNPPFPILIPR